MFISSQRSLASSIIDPITSRIMFNNNDDKIKVNKSNIHKNEREELDD